MSLLTPVAHQSRTGAAGITTKANKSFHFSGFDVHERGVGRAEIEDGFRPENVEHRGKRRGVSPRRFAHAPIGRRPAVVVTPVS